MRHTILRLTLALAAFGLFTPTLAFAQFSNPYLPRPNVPAMGTSTGPYLPVPQVPSAVSPSVTLPAGRVINPYIYGYGTPYLNSGFFYPGYVGFGPVYGGYFGANLTPTPVAVDDPVTQQLRYDLAATVPSLAPPIYPRRNIDPRPINAPNLADLDADGGMAIITVSVPENAEVFLQGKRMEETGSVRRFSSPHLEAGKGYTYTVRAKWTENGKRYDESMDVPVRAGDRKSVAFLAPATGGSMGLTTAARNVRDR
jgi:uncharacterized protein (TIGR03000 family)